MKKRGFEVFLDSDGYASGDNWKRIGEWTLRKTGQLVLIATPKALENGIKDDAVVREVRIFAKTGKRIIPICFAPSGINGNLDHENSTIVLARPSSNVLNYIAPETLSITENVALLDRGPSEDTLNSLNRTFNIIRQDKKRLNVFSLVSVALLILTLTAAFFYNSADNAKDEVSKQLAKNWYEISHNSIDRNFLESYLMVVESARIANLKDQNFALYLNRIVHQSRHLPSRIINLPVDEGVEYAEIDKELTYAALVSENLNLNIFKLSSGKPMFVPNTIYQNKIAMDIPPVFADRSPVVNAFIQWQHPRPDPDTSGRFILSVDWNFVDSTILTPVDDGVIYTDDLKWKFIGGYIETENLDQNLQFDSIAQLLQRRGFIMKGGRNNSSVETMVTSNGTAMFWQKNERGLLGFENQFYCQNSWEEAKLSYPLLVILTAANKVIVWNIERSKEIWSVTIDPIITSGLSISSNDSLIFINNDIYELYSGDLIGSFSTLYETYFNFERDGILNNGERVIAWSAPDELNSIGFEFKEPITDQELLNKNVTDVTREADWLDNLTDFQGFLSNCRYGMFGTGSAFEVYDLKEKKSITTFNFSSESRIALDLARNLIFQSVDIYKQRDFKLYFLLKGRGKAFS